MKEVIISGGTGLIGSYLTQMLILKGYKVNILTRNDRITNTIDLQYYKWDINRKIIPEHIFERADFLINLSGANIGAHRWNNAYKKEILESRVYSTRLLVDTSNKYGHNIKAFLNGSAIGYYGLNNNNSAITENDPPGNDFMARVCIAWENEAKKLDQTRTRLLISRTGIVFSSREGALHTMATPVRYFIGTALGTGRQIISWIHIDDVCRAIVFALENERMTGPFNAVSPNPASNTEIIKAIAKEIHKPLFLPAVPGFILKILLGEMADSVLGGASVSPNTLLDAGFQFNYPDLEAAIANLFENNR